MNTFTIKAGCRGLLLALAVGAMPAYADGGQPALPRPADDRILLDFTPEERAQFLAEMRTMLASIQPRLSISHFALPE